LADETHEKRDAQPRTHLLWVDARDTPADIEAKHLIAAGRAHSYDTFVHVRWKWQNQT